MKDSTAHATRTVGEVTQWLSGGTPDRVNAGYWQGDIPWISAFTLKVTEILTSDQFVSAQAVKAGSKMAPVNSTLLLVRGSALHKEIRTGLVVAPVAFNQDVKALVPTSSVEPKYLTFVLQGNADRLLRLVTSAGNTAGVLDTKAVQDFEIWMPSRREQREIVARLDDSDSLTASLERLIAKKRAIKQGMMQQLLTGKTRLPGFTGSWSQRHFSEVMTRLNAKRHQIPASSYSSVGELPVVDQGKTAIVSYTNDIAARLDPGHEGVVVFGDHTCITKFVNFEFAIGADGTQIVKATPGNSTRFLCYALEADPVVTTGYNRHFKLLREKILPAPRLDEQEAIAKVLADADDEIDALRLRLEKAKSIKRGMMQELLTGRTRLPVSEDAS